MNDTTSANQVRAAKGVEIPFDGQQYVNLVNFVREEYENEMERATHFVIKVNDSVIGNIIRGIVNYLYEWQLAERTERERGQGDDKQRTPSPTEAPREDFPVPAKKPQPQARDVIAQALDAYWQDMRPCTDCLLGQRTGMTAAAQVIVRALLAEARKCPVKESADGYHNFIKIAARNLGLEVRG